jgi:ADP-heptose:LPS heptosyltransferase
MKVDTMRRIDRWVGIPLCFLLTLLSPFFLRRAEGAKPRRILFIELSEMGSTILADPAMRKAKQIFGAELYFLIFQRNAPSLDFLRTIPEENVCTIREDGLVVLALDCLRFFLWARKKGIDTVIDLELFSRFSALLTALCGARHRVGYHRFHNEGLYRGELLTHRVAYNPHMHIAKNFVALVNALACPVVETPYSKTYISDEEITLPRIIAGERESEQMQGRIAAVFPAYDPNHHRVVLFNPNASELLPQRRWPQGHFAALGNMVLKRWDNVIILITGSPDEDFQAEKLKTRTDHPRIVNFAGQVKLAELPVLYEIAALMVTNDSGPGHFASVTDMPIIALFGPETPALYGPLGNAESITASLACSPCVSASNHRKTACRDPLCMQAIPPERVMDSIESVLEQGSLPTLHRLA